MQPLRPLPAQAQESQLPGSGNIHMGAGFTESTSNLHQKSANWQ